MTEHPGNSLSQPATSLMIGASLSLGRTYWALESTIVHGKAEWAFKATPAKGKLDILEAVLALCQEFGAGRPPFKEGMLPKTYLNSLTLSNLGNAPAGNTSYLKALAEIEIDIKPERDRQRRTGELRFKLIVAFAKLGEGSNGEPCYLAGIRSAGPIPLAMSGDGAIGQLLGDVVLDQIGFYYASADIEVDPFVTEGQAEWNFSEGFSIACRIGLRNSAVDVALNSSSGLTLSSPSDKASRSAGKPQDPPPSAQPERPQPSVTSTNSAQSSVPTSLPDGRYWARLDKTLGPLQLRRIGGEWKDSKLGLLLDATIELAGLTVALAGLTVRVPPSKLTELQFKDVEFGLDGMELDFQRGPISISGALLKSVTIDGPDMYSGMASIRAATFSIGAIGSYTSIAGEPSFFIFGAYAGILGGPPCFVLEGIAAGFGYNRAITLPDISQVREFPLVSLVLGKSSGTPTSNMLDMLGQENAFPPVTGQYWIAAGVKFSSFRLIEAFALATVQFGARLEIALLGVATLQQPPRPAQPFIVVEMALKVRFAPDDGLLSVEARLTANSYLFDPSCRLTGGFAFYVWFTPTNPQITDRSGQFVLTLGGYHPKFITPDFYPTVPRVGFSWQLPDYGVSMKGEAYFALTPSFVMAGFRLSAVFSVGPFRAWFEVYADFLIGWEPFHYEGEVGVRIGASYTFMIGDIIAILSFELAAQLTLWGPPFAGETFVDLGIVAFTVPIGDHSAARKAPALTWTGFADKFLPIVEVGEKREHAPLEITIASGLVYDFHNYTVVNPSELCLSVESFVPLLADQMPLQGRSRKTIELGIRPMQLGQFTSSLTLKFNLLPSVSVLDKFGCQPITKNMPEALWSPKPTPVAGRTAIQSDVIRDCLMGVQIKPKEPSLTHEIDADIEIETWNVRLKKPQEKTWVHEVYVKDPRDKLREALGSSGVQAARKRTVGGMSQFGFDIESDLAESGQYGDHSATLVSPPWIVRIGKLIPLEHGQ